MNNKPTYQTGELILPGDEVLIGEWDGTVEFVITSASPDWNSYWKELGEGVMLKGEAFSTLYTRFDDDDLRFIKRK